MNPNCVRKPEQIKLIMECRQSGLSDYQWCGSRAFIPEPFTTGSANSERPAIPFRIQKVNFPLYLPVRKLSGLI